MWRRLNVLYWGRFTCSQTCGGKVRHTLLIPAPDYYLASRFTHWECMSG